MTKDTQTKTSPQPIVVRPSPAKLDVVPPKGR